MANIQKHIYYLYSADSSKIQKALNKMSSRYPGILGNP